jgi:hypothetical protein
MNMYLLPFQGCLEDIVRWFKEDTTLLIGLGIGIAFLHVSNCFWNYTCTKGYCLL